MFQFMLQSDFHFLYYLGHLIIPEMLYTVILTLIVYQIILRINRKLVEEEKGVQAGLFNILEHIKETVIRLVKSRMFIASVVFCVLFAILVQRVFYLQIVKGESYLNDYKLQIQKTKRFRVPEDGFWTGTGLFWQTMSLPTR